MVDVSEKWTCPTCNRTYTREGHEQRLHWQIRAGRLRDIHGTDCPAKETK